MSTTTGHLLGYARVSTLDQNPELQLDALEQAGCARVFVDHASGARADRPELERVLDHLRTGDTLVVYKLDRLGRSLRHLVDTVTDLEQRGVGFRSIRETIDTTTPAGRLIFHIFAALAEFERDLIRERTNAGLQAARARGRKGGRPSVVTPRKLTAAKRMLEELEPGGRAAHTVSAVADTLGVSRASLYRALSRAVQPSEPAAATRSLETPPAPEEAATLTTTPKPRAIDSGDHFDPLAIACPKCEVEPGVRCRKWPQRTKRPQRLAEPHVARGWLGRRCPTCKAFPGEPCCTPSGRRAREPHAPRRPIARGEQWPPSDRADAVPWR